MADEINLTESDKTSPKKRVLFVITQSELGGAQRFLAQLIGHLEPSRFDAAIVCGSDGNAEIKALLPEAIRYITARHLHRNPNVFSDIASVFELKKIIRDFSPDTIFLNSTKAGFIGSLVARLQSSNRNLRTIYRIGGWAFNDPRPWWQKLAIRWLEKISAGWKDIIIVNNKHDYDQAIKFSIKPKKEVTLIHNGIDPYKLDFLEKDEAKIRLYEKLPANQKQVNFLSSNLLIGTIANFYPTKGLEYLLEAIKILETYNPEKASGPRGFTGLKPITYNLVLIGDGIGRGSLESQIKNAGLQNLVFLTGRIADAYKYLKAFDIFVLPSVKEGFPWAMLEAMSAKLPIIATSVGANPEIIENDSPSTTLLNGKVVLGKNGIIVPPADPKSLAEAIAKLIENEALRRELGIQAHQTVIREFTLRKMLEQVKNLL